jgi:transposase
MKVSPKALTSQRFWDHMSRLDQTAIEQIEERFTKRLVERFGLDLRCLIYDATNFYTWIDTMGDAELPQRGHNKAKRNDLKQVGLALLVTTDFHIPLFHRVYAGNTTDSKQFGSVLTDLSARYQALAQSCENITLVFDKGNNAKKNFSALKDTPFHFVGSLTPSQHPDLLAVPADQYRPLANPRLGGVAVYRTVKHLFGVDRTVVVTYNESLYLGQKQGLLLQRRKANDALKDLQRRVLTAFEPGKRGKKPTVESVRGQVDKIIKERGLKREWLNVTVQETDTGISFTYAWNHEAIARHEETVLGKTLLFTDQSEWSDEEIILTYRGQSKIEEAFKKMKNPHFLSWNPRYHWTDPMIRVHAFYCVLALTLISLLQRELHRKGMPMSTLEMLEQLSGIKEVALIYPEDSGMKPQITLTQCNEIQEKLVKELEIASYRSDAVGNT